MSADFDKDFIATLLILILIIIRLVTNGKEKTKDIDLKKMISEEVKKILSKKD